MIKSNGIKREKRMLPHFLMAFESLSYCLIAFHWIENGEKTTNCVINVLPIKTLQSHRIKSFSMPFAVNHIDNNNKNDRYQATG